MAGEVSPTITDSRIRLVKGAHQIFNAKTTSVKTLITIGGTNSHPSDFKNVHEWAAERGYRVIGLDYENELTSVVCLTNWPSL